MLLSVVRTYGGDNRTHVVQIEQRKYMGPLDIRYLLRYPLGNTWTYETPYGPLCKDHQT
jgi:hypothetical protein